MHRLGLSVSVVMLTGGMVGVASPVAAESTSFAGTCSLTGSVTFSPAIGIAPVNTTEYADVSGTCTGTLGRGGATTKVNRAEAHYVATLSAADATCVGGTATGDGTLTIDGTPIRFALTETRIAAVSYLKPVGTRLHEITYLQPVAAVDAVTACLSDGLAGGPIATQILMLPL